VSKRILSTIVLWAVFISALWLLGRPAMVGLVTLMALLTQNEFYAMTQRMGQRPFRKLGLLLGGMIILAPYAVRTVLQKTEISGLMGSLLAISVIICCIRILRERDPAERVDTLSATLFGIIYVPFMMHFIVEIFFLPATAIAGLMLVVWLVVVVKFCDVGALLIGTAIGRHKMAPTISPKKSWEGLVGGVLCGAALGTALIVWLPKLYPPEFTPLISALAAVPIALLAVLSDLVESIIKRRADMKDSGASVPGIGGAFDLTDSVILTAPAAYIVFACVLRKI